MSRYYEMDIEVSGIVPDKMDEILDVIRDEWNIDDVYEQSDTCLNVIGRSTLSGGETEEEFSRRLSQEIWRVNGQFCKVIVRATYLEELPYETYTFDQAEYDVWGDKEPDTDGSAD